MKSNLIRSVLISINLVVICWIIFLVNHFIIHSLNNYGIVARDLSHLTGIIFAPLLHASGPHIISNSVPLFFLTTIILYIYPNISKQVLIFSWILTGLVVWLFADMFGGRIGVHIGASGVIYAEAAFIFFSGIFRRNFLSLIVALMVAILYGGMIFGIFPKALSNVSWESHLGGFLIGTLLAWLYKNKHLDDN